MQDSRETLATALGLSVAYGLLEDEVSRLCGRCCRRQSNRVHLRRGDQQDVSAALTRTLATTNPIESAFVITPRVTARVTRWRDGEMRQR